MRQCLVTQGLVPGMLSLSALSKLSRRAGALHCHPPCTRPSQIGSHLHTLHPSPSGPFTPLHLHALTSQTWL